MAKKEKKPAKVFVPKVLQILKEDKHSKRVSRLQVIRWNVDGQDMAPKLERRDYHLKADGSERMGRGGGLNKADCIYLITHWDEIGMFF